MPYIALERRPNLCVNVHPSSAGELTYVLSVLAENYLLDQAEAAGSDFKFKHISEVLGSLEATKLELYRRVIAPYENDKRAQNGDVFVTADDDEYCVPDVLQEAVNVPEAIFDHFLADIKAADECCDYTFPEYGTTHTFADGAGI